MKRLCCIMALIMLIACAFSSCGSMELNGLNEFGDPVSSMGISERLIPQENFLTDFKYKAGDYHYVNTGWLIGEPYIESEMIYLLYGEKIYHEAKNCMLEKMELSQTNRFLYNGYEFYENVTGLSDNPDSQFEFPRFFNMIAYNDEKCILVFMGFYISNMAEKDIQLLTFDNAGAFLKEYFPFYDFDL